MGRISVHGRTVSRKHGRIFFRRRIVSRKHGRLVSQKHGRILVRHRWIVSRKHGAGICPRTNIISERHGANIRSGKNTTCYLFGGWFSRVFVKPTRIRAGCESVDNWIAASRRSKGCGVVGGGHI